MTASRPRRRALAALALVPLFAALGVAQTRPDAAPPPSQTPVQTSTPTPAPPPAAVQVIPRPKRLTATGERFALKRGVLVVPADARSEDDRFAAEDFVRDVKETAGVTTLRVGRGGGRRGRVLVGALEDERVREALARAR
ncbi:MAG TPA: hypothetical protein VEQ42_10930, partial [Pyrinomonadaceae bacterium]|nr:hypothetical protein [Pyrinomonadaceae bacterium]